MSTVAVMAIVFALLVFKPFGGPESLPGVTLKDGKKPTVTIDDAKALSEALKDGDGPKSAVVDKGDGAELEEGDYVKLNLISVENTEGAEPFSTYDQGTPLPLQLKASETSGLPQAVVDELTDVREGAKVLVALTLADIYGDQAEQAEAQGQDLSLVMVYYFDLQDRIEVAPHGEEQDLPKESPVPVTDGDEVTGIEAGDAPAKATQEVYTVVEGDGAKVEETDAVFVNYHGQIYPAGETFDSSFENGGPTILGLNQVIPCWTEGLAGVTVGSRVVLTCPADKAYGDSPPEGGPIKAGDALTFVIDVLDRIDVPEAEAS
ncbi:MAG: FKBP-type peptidyl-prolyl cis-trans isomerase [Aeromicrobium sp.]|uniref:FKBP-type peptidyl-prolyl cis-trans isomerase n=1 Tax=Aeromicrobium sp. TaxID=1871063 RepID=UPI0039E2D80B